MEERSDAKKNSSETAYYGAITIPFRKVDDRLEFLVVENAETGNVTFVSGAQEEEDADEVATAKRELREELHLPESLRDTRLLPTTVRHEFVFGPKKKDRAGHPGSYGVFLLDLSDITEEIRPTKELKSVSWLSREEVLTRVSFDDLKKIFGEAIQQYNL